MLRTLRVPWSKKQANTYECQFQNNDLDPAYLFPEVYSVMRVFETFQSEYRIRKLYFNHPKFVCPQSIPFSTGVKTVFSNGKNNTKSVINTRKYLPILKTMQAFLLDNQNFLDLREKSKNFSEHGIYEKFRFQKMD